MRSEVIGLRLWGIALEPFWPARNGSCSSPISVCWRLRISVAKRSSEPPVTAIAARNAAWRSRWTICVLIGSTARGPARPSPRPRSRARSWLYVPTAPDSLPVARSAGGRRPGDRRSRRSSKAHEASLRPKRDRLGMDRVGAAHHQRLGVLARLCHQRQPISASASASSRLAAARHCSASAVSTTSEDVSPKWM